MSGPGAAEDGAPGGGLADGAGTGRGGADWGGTDWAALMRAGIGRAGLLPSDFWTLTPAELLLRLGAGQVPARAMNRLRLAALVAAFPDRGRADGPGMGQGKGARECNRSTD